MLVSPILQANAALAYYKADRLRNEEVALALTTIYHLQHIPTLHPGLERDALHVLLLQSIDKTQILDRLLGYGRQNRLLLRTPSKHSFHGQPLAIIVLLSHHILNRGL